MAQVLWSEDRSASLWCGFSLIKPHSGWPPVWCSVCQACGTAATRAGETTRRYTETVNIESWPKGGLCTWHAACMTADQYTLLLSVYIRLSSLRVCWMSQRFSGCLCSKYFCRGTVQTQRLTAVVVPWGTPEALFGPGVTVLVQVSQLWDKNLACHTNASKPQRREEVRRRSPRWPRLLPPKKDGSVIITIIMGLWGVSFVNEPNVMLSELNNAVIAMNNAAQRARCADVSD